MSGFKFNVAVESGQKNGGNAWEAEEPDVVNQEPETALKGGNYEESS